MKFCRETNGALRHCNLNINRLETSLSVAMFSSVNMKYLQEEFLQSSWDDSYTQSSTHTFITAARLRERVGKIKAADGNAGKSSEKHRYSRKKDPT